MNKATSYFNEVKNELQKVEWPERRDVVKLTTTVVIITLIVGGYVGVLDYGFAKLLEFVLSI